jgi:hypothetical protein
LLPGDFQREQFRLKMCAVQQPDGVTFRVDLIPSKLSERKTRRGYWANGMVCLDGANLSKKNGRDHERDNGEDRNIPTLPKEQNQLHRGLRENETDMNCFLHRGRQPEATTDRGTTSKQSIFEQDFEPV